MQCGWQNKSSLLASQLERNRKIFSKAKGPKICQIKGTAERTKYIYTWKTKIEKIMMGLFKYINGYNIKEYIIFMGLR